MDCARTLLALLAAAVLLSNLVVTDLAEHRSFPHPAVVAAMGAGFGQIALCAFCLVHSRCNVTLRVILLLAAVSYWARPIAEATGQAATPWGGVLLAYVATAATAAWAAKALGFRVARTEPAAQPPPKPRWQFRLWDLMSCTTAVCILMAVVRRLEFPWAVVGEAVFFCLGLTAAAMVAMAAFLASRRILPAVPALVAASAVGALMSAARIPPQAAWPVAVMTAIEAACVACGAAVLRASGYRLVRERRVAKE
jgi:hypothetical protein